jgi:phospholipase/carboxylesterase
VVNATDNTWYPQSFLVSVAQNEPYLSPALELIGNLVKLLKDKVSESKDIYYTGFSQGLVWFQNFLEEMPRDLEGYLF